MTYTFKQLLLLAKDPATTGTVLADIATSILRIRRSSEVVRHALCCAVALNPSTPIETLRFLGSIGYQKYVRNNAITPLLLVEDPTIYEQLYLGMLPQNSTPAAITQVWLDFKKGTRKFVRDINTEACHEFSRLLNAVYELGDKYGIPYSFFQLTAIGEQNWKTTKNKPSYVTFTIMDWYGTGTAPRIERVCYHKPSWIDITNKNRIPPIVYVELTLENIRLVKRHRVFQSLSKLNQDYLDDKLRSDIRITADNSIMFLYRMGGDRNIVYQCPGDRTALKNTKRVIIFLTPK